MYDKKPDIENEDPKSWYKESGLISQEIYDAFPDTFKVCTKMHINGMTLHNANNIQSDDYIIGNNMEPTNNITDRSISKDNIYH